MGWKPGESGNPNGRPLGGEALTEILRFFADDQINFSPGTHRVEKKIILARMIWDSLIWGKVEFPDGRVIELEVNEWMNVVKWLYNRTDGMPPQAIDLSGSLQTVNITSDEFAQARAELEEWQQERFGDDGDGDDDE